MANLNMNDNDNDKGFYLYAILVMFCKICFTFVNDGPLYLNNNHDPQYGQIEAKLYSLETSQYLLFYERGVHKANQM